MSLLQKKPPLKTNDQLIGALVRVPTEAIFRRIVRDLNAAGFEGLTLAHLAVLRYPGPDGERPSLLAERAGISKQAMNRLLGSLEDLGYLKRTDASGQSRGRIVQFTRRGHAAWSKIVEILYEIERDWSAELGAKDFAHLKQLLGRVWNSPLIR
jgi:DNA-binding MarR family transcriptional regulator